MEVRKKSKQLFLFVILVFLRACKLPFKGVNLFWKGKVYSISKGLLAVFNFLPFIWGNVPLPRWCLSLWPFSKSDFSSHAYSLNFYPHVRCSKILNFIVQASAPSPKMNRCWACPPRFPNLLLLWHLWPAKLYVTRAIHLFVVVKCNIL